MPGQCDVQYGEMIMSCGKRLLCTCSGLTLSDAESNTESTLRREDRKLSENSTLGSKVSVVIVNWNGARFLERCLAALMVQSVKPREIILVDNASTDGSIEIAGKFPSIKLLALSENTGFARGNNIAIKACALESEWIALLNPDAFVTSDWLEGMLAAALRNPHCDVFACKLVKAENISIADGWGDAYHISGRVWRQGQGAPVSNLANMECEVFSPCAAAALYRRCALDEVGGFDEDYFCYVEDVDLGFRLRLAGRCCLYVPQAMVLHVGSGTTGGQHSDFSVYHGHRNLIWTFVKDMPGLLFWLLLPLHVLLNLVSIVWFGLQGRGRIILRAKRDALLGLPKMWRKRREIQGKRVVSIGRIWRVLDKSIKRL